MSENSEKTPEPKVEATMKEPAHAPDFGKIVEESKARLAADEPKPTPDAPPVKRPVGRPRKDPNAPPKEKKDPVESKMNAAEVVSEIDLAAHLTLPIQALSRIPAQKHQIPELAFSAEEARACAEACNGVINAFAPQLEKMSPQSAAVLSAGLVFGSIGFSKFQIYTQVMEARREERRREVARDLGGEAGAPVEAGPELTRATRFQTHADDHFRRPTPGFS